MMPGRELSLQVAARVLVAALIRAAVVSFGLWLGLGEGSRGPPGEPQLPLQPEVPSPSSSRWVCPRPTREPHPLVREI